MKVYFRKAVKELRKTGDLQVGALHANLVQEIVSGLQDAIEPALLAASSKTPSLAPTESMDDSTISSALQMNSITSDPIIATMQQQLATLTTMIQQMQNQDHSGGRGRGRGGRGGRNGRGGYQGRGRGRGRGYQQNAWQQNNAFNQNQNPNNPFQQNQQNANPFQQQHQDPNNHVRWPRAYNKYYWSHGACGHTSSICRVPQENHCWDATFNNKMNGSTANCS